MKLCVLFALALALFLSSCGPQTPEPEGASYEPESFAGLRAGMVEGVRAAGITDERVLRAMGKVRRHRFVPRAVERKAYELKALPIGEDQTISSPYIVGLMTSLLELDGTESVLEIGTGSGYQAAVLSEMVAHVYTIEIIEKLADRARERLAELGHANVTVRCGDGYKGWPDKAPFDAVIVTAAPPQVPQVLVDELAPGGLMVVPVGRQGAHQVLTLIRKDADGVVSEERLTLVNFVPMVKEE